MFYQSPSLSRSTFNLSESGDNNPEPADMSTRRAPLPSLGSGDSGAGIPIQQNSQLHAEVIGRLESSLITKNKQEQGKLWLELGSTLGKNEKVFLSGFKQGFSPYMCFLKSFDLDKTNVRALACLARTLEPEQKIRLNFNDNPCVAFLKNIACGSLHRPKRMDAKDLFIEALSKDKNVAEAWHGLGQLLNNGATVEIKGLETKLNNKACCIEGLKLTSDYGTFMKLGLLLNETETIDIPRLGRLDRRECFVKTLELEPTLYDAWKNLSDLLKLDETVDISGVGQRLSGLFCGIKAASLNNSPLYRLKMGRSWREPVLDDIEEDSKETP